MRRIQLWPYIRKGTAICAALLLLTLILPVTCHAKGNTKVHFLCITGNSQGQDAILLESDGHFGFIDCGYWKDGPRIQEIMKELGVNKNNLEFVIGTHAHGDHIGYLNDLMDVYEPERIYLMPFDSSNLVNPETWKDDSLANALRKADKLKIPVINKIEDGASETPWEKKNKTNRYTASPHFRFANADIDIYNYEQAEKVMNANDTSLAVKITADGHTALITGDISNTPGIKGDEGYDEKRLASEVGHVDILKLPHHGYRWEDTNAPEDLEKFSASVIIQTGSTDMLDWETKGSDTLTELLRECEKGARYYATTWFNQDIIGEAGLPAISVNMSDLSDNIDPNMVVAALDKKGNLYAFRNGTPGSYSLAKAYISTGKASTSDTVHFYRCNTGTYAVDGSQKIYQGDIEVGGSIYSCIPDFGVCVKKSQSSAKEMAISVGAPIMDPMQLPSADPQTAESYYDNTKAKDFLKLINSYRKENGLNELVLREECSYAEKRALGYVKGDVEQRTDEVIIPGYLELEPSDAYYRTRGVAIYKNNYLGEYSSAEVACYVSPWADAYVTVYAVEFYTEDNINMGDMDSFELPAAEGQLEPRIESDASTTNNTETGEESVLPDIGIVDDTISTPDIVEQEPEEGGTQEESFSEAQESDLLLEEMKENNRLLSRLVELLEKIAKFLFGDENESV